MSYNPVAWPESSALCVISKVLCWLEGLNSSFKYFAVCEAELRLSVGFSLLFHGSFSIWLLTLASTVVVHVSVEWPGCSSGGLACFHVPAGNSAISGHLPLSFVKCSTEQEITWLYSPSAWFMRDKEKKVLYVIHRVVQIILGSTKLIHNQTYRGHP